MKFEFEQNTEDLLDFSRDQLRSNKTIKYIVLGFLLFILVNIGTTLMNEGIDLTPILSWILPIILIGFLWIFLFKFFVKKRLLHPDNKKLFIGKRTIEFLPNHIAIEAAISNSTIQWSAATKFRESNRSYFIYLGKSQAIIIPKRVFNGESEKNEFENFIKERINKH